MAFKNLLLPIAVDITWRSASTFETSIVQTDNASEKRNANRSSYLARADLHYNARKKAIWQEIDEMFQICLGRAHCFKVRDPRKYTASAAEGKFVGSQAVLRTTRGAYTLDKRVTKLGSDVVLTGGGTVDAATGLILTGAPSAWAGTFFLCMRFDTDELDIEGLDRQAASGDLIAGAPAVPLLEVQGTASE